MPDNNTDFTGNYKTDNTRDNTADLPLYHLMTEEIEEKLRRAMPHFTDRFPHITTTAPKGLKYPPELNKLWTSSFFPGMLYLAYDRTQNPTFLANADAHLRSFTERLNNRIGISHDLGFLYTLSSVALYKVTGREDAKAAAQAAADVLAERYNEKGRFIQAWGKMGEGNPYVKMIVDTMLNLPLLFWSANEAHHEMALNHANTCADYLVRNDYSSYHTYLMDPESGKAIVGRTHQGYRDESTWARGQAWIVTGFALAYSYTQEPRFLEVAQKSAEVFLKNLPADHVPYWDFTFTDDVPDIRDTSAASIFTCGLLELAKYSTPDLAETYRNHVYTIVRSLYDHYFLHDPDRICVLTNGMFHRDSGSTGTIWGDYFFYETLIRLQKDWDKFW